MKLEKIKNIKQKIITIPIIMMTLISFIIPNYANAGWFSDTSDNMFKSLIDFTLVIPDALLLAMQNFLTDKPMKYSEMITKKSAKELFVDDIKDLEGTWLGPIANVLGGLASVPGIGSIAAWMGNYQSDVTVDMTNNTFNLMSIFSNKVEAFNVNFFKKTTKPSEKNIAANLRNVIATWYVALRNIALVLMLLVLVFIGIKITVSSVASDKAKYKQLLMDWLIGICLLIFMHYIMVFAVNLVESIDNMFTTTAADGLMNMARTNASLPIDSTAAANGEDANTAVDNFYWALIYCVLVMYMLTFSWQYLQRVVKIAFLTLFAPIMALTYPLDKISDGKAQGFNRWLKDYIFTLLIQPFHLLVYTILISSVQSLVLKNPLYALVALGSLIPMEKMLREFLGFDRGHIKGPNPMGPLATASLLGNAAKQLMPSNTKNKKNQNGSNGGSDNDIQEKPIDTSRGDRAIDLLADGEVNSEEKQGIKDFTKYNSQEDKENRENSNNNENIEELDETGKQWQDYINMQENEENAKLQKEQNLNNEELDKTGKQWQDYIDMQEDDETEKLPREQNLNNQELEKQSDRDRFGMKGNKFKAIGRGIDSVLKMKKPVMTNGLKTIAKIAGATTLGTAGLIIGAASGISTGSLSHTVKHAVAGAAGGAALGSKGTGEMFNLVSGSKNTVKATRNVIDAFQSGYDPVEYQKKLKERQAEQDYKNIINDNSTMLALRTKAQKYNITDEQLRKTIRNYSNQGITNPKDISKGIELQQEAGATEKQAMGAIKLSKDFDKSTLRKDEAKVKQEIQNNLQGKDANPEQKAQQSIDLMKRVYGIKL